MIYFLFPIVLLIYCEILGRAFFSFIKKEALDFSFIVGFILIIAVTYIVGWPITAFNGSFYTLLVLYGLLFIISIIFIIKQFKEINWHFNYKFWIVFVLLVIFESYITLNRTLGETHGFDTLYYLNMVSFNIGNIELNSLHPHFGTYPNTDVQWITYVFQSYYYLIEVIIYVVRNVVGLFGKSFENLPALTLCFQLFLHAIFVGTSLTCIKELKTKKWLQVAFVFLLVFFMNNFYYNNSLGFIGNSYRMPMHAIATLYLFRYFKYKDKEDFSIFMITNLAICGMASTGTFSFVFILFGLFFYFYDKEPNLIKWYAVFLLVPTINVVVVKLGQNWLWVVATVIVFTIIYFLNDWVLKIFKNKYVRYGFVIAILIVLYVLNIKTSGKLFDISKFFDNYSENADMSWDYFEFKDIRHWIFNLLVLIPLTYYVIKQRKEPFAIAILMMILTVFNPLFSYFINKINWVYYRSYDLFINNFTIIFFINYLINTINKKEIQNVLIGTTVVSSIVLGVIQVPHHYDDSFVVKEGYNKVMRIYNKELEVIYNVRELIKEKGIKNPKIINAGTFYMPSFINDGKYLYGKEKRFNTSVDNFDLYLIFFPHDVDLAYDNFYPKDARADFSKTGELLKESGYDILVLDDNIYYQKDGKGTPLRDLVEECGYIKTKYSTDSYSVYYLK